MNIRRPTTLFHVSTNRFDTGRFKGTNIKKSVWTFKSKTAFLRAVEQWTEMDPAEFTITVHTEEAIVR